MIAIYKKQDGSCGALIQCDFSVSIADIVAKDAPKNPDGSTPEFVSAYDTEIPDLEYIGSFKLNGKNIDIDIPKAKEIRRNHFRALRKAKLEKLDIEAIKALEAGDAVKLADISSKKQALRDVTKLPLPDTLEEIRATLPAILA